ncbi:MAG: hypothetical protein ACI4S1_13680 [Roseburia sp.]
MKDLLYGIMVQQMKGCFCVGHAPHKMVHRSTEQYQKSMLTF